MHPKGDRQAPQGPRKCQLGLALRAREQRYSRKITYPFCLLILPWGIPFILKGRGVSLIASPGAHYLG